METLIGKFIKNIFWYLKLGLVFVATETFYVVSGQNVIFAGSTRGVQSNCYKSEQSA